MEQSVIMPSTYWWKGAVDILSCKRRRVVNKSMEGREEGMRGKEQQKHPS